MTVMHSTCPECGVTEKRYYDVSGLKKEFRCICREGTELKKALFWIFIILALIGLMGH